MVPTLSAFPLPWPASIVYCFQNTRMRRSWERGSSLLFNTARALDLHNFLLLLISTARALDLHNHLLLLLSTARALDLHNYLLLLISTARALDLHIHTSTTGIQRGEKAERQIVCCYLVWQGLWNCISRFCFESRKVARDMTDCSPISTEV